VHELSSEERNYFGRADVSISDVSKTVITSKPATEARSAPFELSLPAVDFERYIWLEIRDRRNRRVVTVLELLSPTNKTPGPDRNEYLAKRAEILAGTTHLVEIDLGRGGERPRPPQLPACDYYVLVRRTEERPDLDLW